MVVQLSVTSSLPDAERIVLLNSAQWIESPIVEKGLRLLEDLLNRPTKHRMQNCLVISDTNGGKTTLLRGFELAHPPILGGTSDELPVLMVEVPARPTVASFYGALLEEIGAPIRRGARSGELEPIVLRVLRDASVRMLIIDEVHNMSVGTVSARHEFLNVLRYLGNQLRIPIVAAGTTNAYLFIRSDPQLENRFQPFVIPSWQLDDDFYGLLASFEALLPLRKRSNLAVPAMAEYLLKRSEGTIGELADLLARAGTVAIETGEERISQAVLMATDYNGPRARRNASERLMP